MLAISLTIACSRYIYYGVILHAHPVRGESHNQRNTAGEVAAIVTHTKRTSDRIGKVKCTMFCNFQTTLDVREFDVSVDLKYALLQYQRQSIYSRLSNASYYIYNIETR